MATDINAAIATQLNLSSPQAVRRARQALVIERTRAPTPSRGAPDPLGLSLDRRRGISLDTGEARRAVDTALTTGRRIVSDLRRLEAALTTAINSGLVSSRTELRLDETRVSRNNIQSQAGRTLDTIDRLVARAETGGVNLISSRQGEATIQTTEFGGRVTVRAQPLDSRGLNLRDLSVLTSGEAQEARARVSVAIDVAEGRIGNLRALQDTLEFRGGTARTFLNFAEEVVFAGEVRGRIVNLRA